MRRQSANEIDDALSFFVPEAPEFQPSNPVTNPFLRSPSRIGVALRVAEQGLNQTRDELRSLYAKFHKQRVWYTNLRSCLSPFERTPDEILAEIFLHAKHQFSFATANHEEITVMRQVCRRWNQVATGTPQLWTDICIVPSYHPKTYVPKKFWNIKQLKIWMERSKNAAIDVTIFIMGLGSNMTHLDPAAAYAHLLQPLVDHSHRWRSLMVCGPGADSIISLVLNCTPPPSSTIEGHTPAPSAALPYSCLTTLSIAEASLGSAGNKFLRDWGDGLIDLCIIDLSLDDYLPMVFSTPNLRRLEIGIYKILDEEKLMSSMKAGSSKLFAHSKLTYLRVDFRPESLSEPYLPFLYALLGSSPELASVEVSVSRDFHS